MDDSEHNRALDVWTVDVESREMRCLTNSDLMSQLLAWSPDGQTIAFYARPETPAYGYQDVHVWTVPREGGESRDASAQLDRFCVGIVLSDYMLPADVPPAWSPDGETIYFIAVDRGARAIFALSLRDGSVRRVSQTAALVGGAQCSPDGRTLVCFAATATQPFDVFTVPAKGGELHQVTWTNADLIDEVSLAPTEPIQFKGAGNWDIEGWLVTPGDDVPRPYGLILLVHGGPQAAWGNAFYFWCQVLAGAGYASLLVNPRGSIGYGEDFARAADWGQSDFQDLLAGVDFVLARGDVDAGKLGITGASYGGFMTNWALGHTDRFAAGVAVNSISNFTSFYGVSDIGASWFERSFKEHFGGRFWQDREHWEQYIARSPITYVENIKAPLLLISAENDYRCPIEQAEQMLTALRMLHRTVQLIRIPGASHGVFASPHQRYVRWQVTRDWFDTYLKGELVEQAVVAEEAVAAPEPVPVPAGQT
jgi:dipeptidyl aminopeptidase/acylaminoacyl peptidase